MNRQKNTGFTLLEAMIVVAIIGILAVLAVPSFSEQMKQQRLEGAAEGLVAALQNAKAEAVKSNQFVGIEFTPTANGTYSTWCYGMTPPAATAAASACDCRCGRQQFPSTRRIPLSLFVTPFAVRHFRLPSSRLVDGTPRFPTLW